jgi:hypothetical protein
MSILPQDDELHKLLTTTSEYKESEDFDLALEIYVDVIIEEKEVARMSLDYVPDTDGARCMRIHFHPPEEGDEPGTLDQWTAELRAITRIMEVARPILEAVETKLRHAGREAWENQSNPSSELFGYK